MDDYCAINRRAWSKLAQHGCIWTRPVSDEVLARARELVDPYGWLEWKPALEVLCLASGGGQQAVRLGALVETGRSYDLVYQPVSTDYVPDVNAVYREVARVLRPGGQYLVTHWNPVYWQLDERWADGYRVVRPQRPGQALVQEFWEIDGQRVPIGTLEFFHPLDDLIGGLCRAGFVIEDFREGDRGDPDAPPGSWEHLRNFFPPLLAIKARRVHPR